MSRFTGWICGCAFALALGHFAEAQPAPEYEVEFLGAASGVHAINNSGVCVGDYLPPVSGAYERGWVSVDGGPLEFLPLPPGMQSSTARDINDAGQIVGLVGTNFTSEVGYAATWIPDGAGGYDVELLGSIPGFEYSLATSINNVGDIVGYGIVPFTGGGWPVLYQPGGNVSLAEVYGMGYICWDVNDARQVVGIYDQLDLNTGVVESLPIAGRAINAVGQVAGSQVHSFVTPTSYDAVRYTPGEGVIIVTIQPTQFTFAYGINDLGDVVFETPAAVYFDGIGSFDLNDLIAPTSSGWQVTSINWDIDINNSRQILAMALNPGTNDYGAARLTPVGNPIQFIRGDVDGDGSYGLPDAIVTLTHLFVSPSITCLSAADVDDDDVVGLVDAIYTLLALFASGPEPAAPFPACGPDPTPGGLDCPASPCP